MPLVAAAIAVLASACLGTQDTPFLSVGSPSENVTEKLRVIHTTDIGIDPDDEMSLVRQLVMADQVDIEGLIATTSCWSSLPYFGAGPEPELIHEILDAYDEVYDNLVVHSAGFPEPDYLRSITVTGQTGIGMAGITSLEFPNVGEGLDTAGSELIIAAVDKPDPRPVWLTCWGGCNTIAQALWKVQNERSPQELAEFIRKIRIYDILGQDDAGAWIANTFPEAFYIRATAVLDWQADDAYFDRIQSKGPLGAVYPEPLPIIGGYEGDTPAFMHLAYPGLNDPDMVTQGGWGGRFDGEEQEGIRGVECAYPYDPISEARFDPYYMIGNLESGSDITRFRPAYDNDFLARMDWSLTADYAAVNHHPTVVVNKIARNAVMHVEAKAGSLYSLSAVGSSDPDGDMLSYQWQQYPEADSYPDLVTIHNANALQASVEIPADASGHDIHVILSVNDDGTDLDGNPLSLYAYRRIVIRVE